jgi:Fungal specific transcription factor domain
LLLSYVHDACRFFENIYIHAPFINKAQFLHGYNNPECSGSRDEFLLAAICAIGARFLPEDIVYAAPRQDGKSFDIVKRKSTDIVKFFEHKANTILDIAFKRSRISTLQTLVLITMYFEHSNDPEETSARWFIAGAVSGKRIPYHYNSQITDPFVSSSIVQAIRMVRFTQSFLYL